MDFSTAIGNTKTEDDETSHKTIVAEVTSVCDDHHKLVSAIWRRSGSKARVWKCTIIVYHFTCKNTSAGSKVIAVLVWPQEHYQLSS